jgi:hopanoid biosynthesis associated protein HpnK
VGTQGSRLKKLIVTADDFGISREVNEAVENAHLNGILTATSLMVGEPFADDAVKRAKKLPKLAVGLHLALSRAFPSAPLDQIPDMIGPDGLFRSDLVDAGFRFFFLPKVRRQLKIEITAQFDAFAATGLSLDHVNAHNHLHLHPTVLSLMLEIGKSYGMRSIRLPRDDNAKGLGAVFLKPWLKLMQARLDRNRIQHNDVLLGLDETGFLDTKTLIYLIEGLSDQTAELMCHPATGPWKGMDPLASEFRHDREYEALIDASTIAAINDLNVSLIAYRDLE